MPVSILETLKNAEHNFRHGTFYEIGQAQLHNAIVLLEKGYSPYEQVEPLLEKWGALEEVPDREVQHER